MKKFIPLIILISIYFAGFPQNFFDASAFDNSILEKNSRSDEIKIYPNPCKQEKITVELFSKEIMEIQITNIAGKEVLIEKLRIPENKKQIQLTGISNGIYLMRVKTSDDNYVVKKIIIAKE